MLAIPAITVRVLRAAYDACRTGGLEDQYQTLGSIGAGMDYAVSRSFCTREALEQVAMGVALNTSHLPVDAKPVGFDAEKQLFSSCSETPSTGRRWIAEALCDDVEAALAQGGGEVELKFTYTEAEVPVDGYGLIATYSTDASTSSSARIHNIRLAMSAINGTCLQPGETFSFNGRGGQAHQRSRLSPRARLRGDADRHGIRRRHLPGILDALRPRCSRPGSRSSSAIPILCPSPISPRAWTPRWTGATRISSFKNNRSEPIYIACYVDGFEQVHVSLYGSL